MPIDCVLYADTGMEFPEMEAHIAKLDDLLYRERGIHITTLRHPHGFEWLMFDVPQQQKRAIERRIAMDQPLTGYGWPGMKVRWCTGQLKTHLVVSFTCTTMANGRSAFTFGYFDKTLCYNGAREGCS